MKTTIENITNAIANALGYVPAKKSETAISQLSAELESTKEERLTDIETAIEDTQREERERFETTIRRYRIALDTANRIAATASADITTERETAITEVDLVPQPIESTITVPTNISTVRDVLSVGSTYERNQTSFVSGLHRQLHSAAWQSIDSDIDSVLIVAIESTGGGCEVTYQAA